MKLALITDTHAGARNDSQVYAAYFQKFFDSVFFPYIDEHEIKTIVHLGDIVDRRKYINFGTASRLRETFLEPCKERDLDVTLLLGNHDVTYKSSNDLNAATELHLDSVYGFDVIAHPSEKRFGDLNVCLLPWINPENEADCLDLIGRTSAPICMAHLELTGYQMARGQLCDHGMSKSVFDKFAKVFTGHFHHKSDDGHIFYLGAPYEMTWIDYNDPKGFHIFDTETLELSLVQNPHVMFKKFYYDDADITLQEILETDFSAFAGNTVKVFAKKGYNPYNFDMFMNRLESFNLASIQVIHEIEGGLKTSTIEKVEDTEHLIKNYIEDFDVTDKDQLGSYMFDLYNRAQMMEQA